jgi:hypothetical protein
MKINEVSKWLTPEQIIEIAISVGYALNHMSTQKRKNEKLPETINDMDYATPLYGFAEQFGLAGADSKHGQEESNAIFSVMQYAYEKAHEKQK